MAKSEVNGQKESQEGFIMEYITGGVTAANTERFSGSSNSGTD